MTIHLPDTAAAPALPVNNNTTQCVIKALNSGKSIRFRRMTWILRAPREQRANGHKQEPPTPSARGQLAVN